MGVKVRERPKGSGVWWIFIDHKGKRKAKKIGSKKVANEVAKKIQVKLTLGEFDIEKDRPSCPTFKEYANSWLFLPHEWSESTLDNYRRYLQKTRLSCLRQ